MNKATQHTHPELRPILPTARHLYAVKSDTSMRKRPRKRLTRRTMITGAALLMTWIAWGASFPFISLTVKDVPPLAAMGARFLAAGLILALIAMARGEFERISLASIKPALIAGTGLVAVGMGMTAWSEQSIPAGTAALVAASAPLWMSISARLIFGQRMGGRAALGVFAGLCGVSVLVAPSLLHGAADTNPIGLGVMLVSALAWGVTTTVASRSVSSIGLLQSTAIQLSWGGFLLMIAARIRGEEMAASLVGLSPVTLAAWSFLVVVAGVMAYSSYAWLLANVSPRLASTHAFVNPVIALLLSWLVLGEQIGPAAGAAAALVTLAVVLLGTAPTPEPAPVSRRQ